MRNSSGQRVPELIRGTPYLVLNHHLFKTTSQWFKTMRLDKCYDETHHENSSKVTEPSPSRSSSS